MYVHNYMWCPSRISWCFPKVLTLWLPHRLQFPLPQHQVLMSLSSLDQAEDDEERLSKWVDRGLAKTLQRVGETVAYQNHFDNLSGQPSRDVDKRLRLWAPVVRTSHVDRLLTFFDCVPKFAPPKFIKIPEILQSVQEWTERIRILLEDLRNRGTQEDLWCRWVHWETKS